MPGPDWIEWLARWYLAQCDGDWEHDFGVRLETLDNPGWRLRIDLKGTALEHRPFARVQRGTYSDNLEGWQELGSWWDCRVEAGCFEANCGPLDLAAAVGVFRAWAAGSATAADGSRPGPV